MAEYNPFGRLRSWVLDTGQPWLPSPGLSPAPYLRSLDTLLRSYGSATSARVEPEVDEEGLEIWVDDRPFRVYDTYAIRFDPDCSALNFYANLAESIRERLWP